MQQEFEIERDGYYLFVTNCRIYGVKEGSLHSIVAYGVDSGESGDPIAGVIYQYEYSWMTLVSLEYMSAGKHTKSFACSASVNAFNTRTTICML